MNIIEKPIWKEGLHQTPYPNLTNNLSSDVVIVGGGLAGILTAYLLRKAGKNVVVLEKKKVGSGATEYTTAFITQQIDTDLSELISLFGEEKAKLVWQSGGDAIDLIEKIVKEENIECEFMRTSLVSYVNSEDQVKELKEERDTQSRFGFDVGEVKQDLSLNFRNYGNYELRNQAKFHPLKFLTALAKICTQMGVKIYENSEVENINHSESMVTVETKTNQIDSKYVVIATYQPFNNRIRMFLKRGMYKSYVFGVKLPKNTIPIGLYQDFDNPYHYFRIDEQSDHDLMIIGGEDVKTIFKIDKARNFQALEEYLQELLPGVQYEIMNRWVGPILEPSDGLPLIGETYDRELVATAFSGNGMTYSAVAAMILTDKILGYSNIYASVYDPKRIPNLKQLFSKGADYIEEFFGGAAKNILKKKQSLESK
jgi:glycine/D-amino acid oxidase-like deaminating enzyme